MLLAKDRSSHQLPGPATADFGEAEGSGSRLEDDPRASIPD
jgi:hypothetical protein